MENRERTGKGTEQGREKRRRWGSSGENGRQRDEEKQGGEEVESSSENVRNWLGDRNTAKWLSRMKWPVTVFLCRDYTQDTAFLQDTGVFLTSAGGGPRSYPHHLIPSDKSCNKHALALEWTRGVFVSP